MTTPRGLAVKPYLFAGDRALAVRLLNVLIEKEDPPEILCLSELDSVSHAEELTELFRSAGGESVIKTSDLSDPDALIRVGLDKCDFALSVHFPELVRAPALKQPERGWLNLHPSYLPFNRGWNTPSWSILEGTPAGVSLHQMVEALDAGDVLCQRMISVRPSDTAQTLYDRLLDAEFELLLECWPTLRSGEKWNFADIGVSTGTIHHKSDLFEPSVQLLDLDERRTVRSVLDQLRALTTNRLEEAAYFDEDGMRVRVQVNLQIDGGGYQEATTEPR